MFFFYCRKLDETKLELIDSEYYKNALRKLKDCGLDPNSIENNLIRVVCFGLGNFATCLSSRTQLSFIRLIIEQFKVTDTLFSDPAFRSGEIEILHKFGYRTADTNLEGKLKITGAAQDNRVLFYLPHCPTQLTNNILFANWGPHLSHFIVIGNSISSIISNSVQSYLTRNAGFLLKIEPAICEYSIEDNYKTTNIFNDTAVHRFERLDEFPVNFWCDDITEPVYDSDDLEIILKDGKQNGTTNPYSSLPTG